MKEQFLSHHIVSIAIEILTLVFLGVVLRQRRPTGSAFAWMLIIVFVPYVGIPLYLMFGGRKYQRQRSKKTPLASATQAKEGPPGPFGLRVGVATSITSARLLSDGVAAYRDFLAQIRAAKKSIRVTTFVIGNDETGTTLLAALAERARAGVEVRLLIDDFLAARAPRKDLDKLRAAGGKIARFMPLLHIPFRGQANLRNHRKMALFDGARAIVGGMNWADEYMGPRPLETRWRDLSMELTGEAAAALDDVFRADWEFASGEVLAPASDSTAEETPEAIDTTSIRLVPSGPDAPSDPIYELLLTGVFRAERRFWISTPYFVPDEPLVNALVLAAHRGVDVRILVPAVSNHALADLVAAPFLRQLQAEGATIKRLDQMLHAKAVLVDDTLAMVGSANFDMRSLFLDYEIAVFFTGAREIAPIAKWFDETTALARANAIAPGFFRKRVESIARLVAPLV